MTHPATTYHVPVLLHESIGGLAIHDGGIYVDATFGGGGHSREMLRQLHGTGHLYSFDQDSDAEANIGPDVPENFTFVRSNFRYLKNWMRYYGVEHIDGLLADLGVSSHHFDDEERGFSFRFDAPLDMRMNKRDGLTAADLLRDYTEERLADVLYLYGEFRQSRRLAAAIVKARQQKPIATTAELAAVAAPLLSKSREKKEMARLSAATDVLAVGGRLSIITYHSLEDRLVKNVMRSGNAEGKVEKDFFGQPRTPYRLVNSKVIVPTAEEQERNPRSRSAKLRIAERTDN